MSNFLPLFQQLRALLENSGVPSLALVISTLDLDMSASTVTQTRAGDFVIVGARRQSFPLTPGIVVSATGPKRMIFLVLEGSDRIGYTEDLMAGLSAWIEQSKRVEGFSCVASLGGAEIGCTVSSADQRLDAMFCIRREAGAPRSNVDQTPQ